jgi:hypothetical protein
MTVMMGIDPQAGAHGRSSSDEHGAVLDQLRLDADVRQIARLLGWAAGWPERTWAIENANRGSVGCSPASCSRPASRSVTCPRRPRPRPASAPWSRSHEQLVKIIPGGVERHLSANRAAAVLRMRKIRPTGPVAAMRRHTIVELLAELRTLDRERKTIDPELTGTSSGSSAIRVTSCRDAVRG